VTGRSLTAPAPLTSEHDLTSFECGDDALNDWLRKRAMSNQVSNASRTFVICVNITSVVGYYSLATGSIARELTPGAVRRNMPGQIPVIILGRLAVDLNYQGIGLGNGMLRDAFHRVLHVSRDVAVRAILVHAISADAQRFYRKNGFVESEFDPMTLLLPVSTIAQVLQS
jgi:GNAT superfamily N-acetyltransferase